MAELRLIDANALINQRDAMFEIKTLAKEIARQNGGIDEAVLFLKEAYDKIEAMPTIDAVPVVHARWEWYEDWGPSTWLEPPDLNKAGWKCSNCGIDLGDYLTDCLGVNVYVDDEDKMPKIKRCPLCGAKMDGATDNNVGGKRKEATP